MRDLRGQKMAEIVQRLDLARLDGGRMHIRGPYLPLFLEHGLASVRAVMDFPGAELCKGQGSRSVCRFSLIRSGGQGDFFLKRHRHPSRREQLGEFLRRGRFLSGARREWEGIWQLRQLGMATVEPVGFGELRRWGWEAESFLITEELKGAARLTEFIPQQFPPPLSPSLLAEKRHLLRSLARLIGSLHGGGWYHRDLYLGHFFVKPKEGGNYELYLLDLQRVIRPRWRRRRWMVKDLASLNFSAPFGWFTACDRLRFFKEYRQIVRLDRGDKSLIRRILRKSRRIRIHTGRLLERGEIKNAPWGWERDVA
ncbi:MAG: lipopolysaccharide kinase InaA family protein [candidate division NC10 bacterium]|nr:lipopolysaccharide kinase InaA family protein [candidate division NC10 bacterium]